MHRATTILLRAKAPIVPRLVICDGDSITRGIGKTTTVNNTYPLDASVSFPRTWPVPANTGVDGEQFSTMLTNFTSVITPLIKAAHSRGWKAIVSCAGGTNDIGLTTTPNPQTLLTTATSYFTAAKAAGADYCIAWTLMARTAGLASLVITQSAVLTYNDLLRGYFAGQSNPKTIDYLIDAGYDAQIGNPTNVTNAFVFADGLHPTIYGMQVMGNLLAAGATSFESRCVVTSVSSSSGSHVGGASISIKGSGFNAANAVIIGGQQSVTIPNNVPVPTFQVNSDSLITALVPPIQGTFWPWPYLGDISVISPSGCGQLRNIWQWT